MAEGTIRTAMPGSLFTLRDHAGAAGQRYLITAVVHHARNNLAERVPQITELLGPAPQGELAAGLARPADLYRNRIETVSADLPWRPLMADAQGRHIHPRPTARGTLTAIVVGPGEPTHTDRDLRVRVQFPCIELSTTEYRSRLQLGHLREQNDNARLNHRGHGGDLSTQASAALRAGSGLLLSADARANASSSHLDSREPIARTENALSLSHSLAELAGKQNAALKGDPAADKLPALDALKHAIEVLETTSTRGPVAASDGLIKTTRGGDGTVPAWSEPRLQYSAPAGIAQLTPNNHFLFAGKNLSIAAGHDANFIAQRNHSIAVKDGIAIFTHGKAKNSQKPNQETGTHLHAASGKVSLQSQSGKTIAAADKKVTFASTHASLNVAAPKHVLLTAKGAYIKLSGGNIEVHAPGKVLFKASMKNWTGPKSASPETVSFPHSDLVIRSQKTAKYPVSI